MRHPLLIRIKKNADGGASLTCTRPDGTVTWHRHTGAQATFLPRHDLTHYAVESVLSRLHGFYSLVAAGWDLSDFGTPSPRGKVPADADSVEAVVGFLDLERASGNLGSAEDLNAYLASRCLEQRYGAPALISSEELALIRQTCGELFAKWDAIPHGQALELAFNG